MPVKYYVFLRGVNVGGNAKVDMARLKSGLASKGYDRASTYLNSGNVVLESSGSKEEIELAVSRTIVELFHIEVKVIAKSHAELESILASNPFTDPGIDKSKVIIDLLSSAAERDDVALLSSREGIDEDMRGDKDVLYIYYKGGIGRSKLTTGYIERTLKVYSTGRNLRTMEALLLIDVSG